MRVTNGMMQSQMMSNLNNNLTRLNKLQDQTSSGSKLSKPSDDPSGIAYALRYRSELAYNDQHQTNTDSALSWMESTDSMLGQAGEIVKRLNELATQGANGTNEQTGLDSIKKEMEELKNQLIDIGNTRLNGKYIFNGENFTEAPYDKNAAGFDAAQTTTNSAAVKFTVSGGVTMDVNVTGNEVFGQAGAADNLFGVIDRMITALTNGNHAGVAGELSNLQASQDNIITARAQIGAKTNRIELVQSRLEEMELNLTELQANVEDADIDKVLISASAAQSVYEASLAVGSKIISTSLIDFMK